MIGLVPRTRPTIKTLGFDALRLSATDTCDPQRLIEAIAAHLRRNIDGASLQRADSIGAKPEMAAKAMGRVPPEVRATRTREAAKPHDWDAARRFAPLLAEMICTPLRTVHRA